MGYEDKERQDGMKWFFGAGLFAILFAIFLVSADQYLTTSKRDKVLGETLRELRNAQHSLRSGPVDPRMNNYLPGQASEGDAFHEFNYADEGHSGHGGHDGEHHEDTATAAH